MKHLLKNLLLMLPLMLLMGCTNTPQPTATSPFEYREVYLPQLTSDVYVPLSLNSIDRDWESGDIIFPLYYLRNRLPVFMPEEDKA